MVPPMRAKDLTAQWNQYNSRIGLSESEKLFLAARALLYRLHKLDERLGRMQAVSERKVKLGSRRSRVVRDKPLP